MPLLFLAATAFCSTAAAQAPAAPPNKPALVTEETIHPAADASPATDAEPVINSSEETIKSTKRKKKTRTFDVHKNEPPATEKNHPTSGWMDTSHLFVTRQSDNLVRWFDGFFGVPRSDLESAKSFLRVRLDEEWDQDEGSSLGVRVRGKVRLPRVNERIGLIFSDERGDETGAGDSIEALSEGGPSNDVALQYTGIDAERSRLDFKLGFRAGLKIKLAARYRYEKPLPKNMLARFSEELYFRDGEGFGTFSRLDFDKTLRNKQLLRWTNRMEWGEKTRGVEWGSSISLAHRINDKSAVSYFANIEGDTRPNELTRSYGFGATYRRNFLRKWLFFELEPAYVWRRNFIEEPIAMGEPYYEDRHGAALFTARLEVLFGTDQL